MKFSTILLGVFTIFPGLTRIQFLINYLSGRNVITRKDLPYNFLSKV